MRENLLKENLKSYLFKLHDHKDEVEEMLKNNRDNYDLGVYDTLNSVTLMLWSILQSEDRL